MSRGHAKHLETCKPPLQPEDEEEEAEEEEALMTEEDIQAEVGTRESGHRIQG
jgi:hypothetical protein